MNIHELGQCPPSLTPLVCQSTSNVRVKDRTPSPPLPSITSLNVLECGWSKLTSDREEAKQRLSELGSLNDGDDVSDKTKMLRSVKVEEIDRKRNEETAQALQRRTSLVDGGDDDRNECLQQIMPLVQDIVAQPRLVVVDDCTEHSGSSSSCSSSSNNEKIQNSTNNNSSNSTSSCSSSNSSKSSSSSSSNSSSNSSSDNSPVYSNTTKNNTNSANNNNNTNISDRQCVVPFLPDQILVLPLAAASITYLS